MANFLLLNGPNLNLLGLREPEIYGSDTLGEIEKRTEKLAKSLGHELSCFQSNHEGAMLDFIQESFFGAAASLSLQKNHSSKNKPLEDEADDRKAGPFKFQGIIINPGAWTHTSVALRDCLAAVLGSFPQVGLIEIHLSNTHKREEFRKKSFISDLATGVIQGLGPFGYEVALRALDSQLQPNSASPENQFTASQGER